jgi:hypothetical protein
MCSSTSYFGRLSRLGCRSVFRDSSRLLYCSCSVSAASIGATGSRHSYHRNTRDKRTMITLCFDLSYNRKPRVLVVNTVQSHVNLDIRLLPRRDVWKGINEYERKEAKAMLFAQSRHSAALAAFSVAASHCHAKTADLCSRPAAQTRARKTLVQLARKPWHCGHVDACRVLRLVGVVLRRRTGTALWVRVAQRVRGSHVAVVDVWA